MPEQTERWAIVRNSPVFYREGAAEAGSPVIVHLHGFAISGRYMVPTAEVLADDFATYVPDLPGFGRSLPPDHPLTIPELADSAAAFLDVVGVERATILGNSLGCAILAAFAERHPDRIERAVMVSPAGGVHSQPLLRALWQLARDAPREPLSMARVSVPDYLGFGVADALRLFVAMTRSRPSTRCSASRCRSSRCSALATRFSRRGHESARSPTASMGARRSPSSRTLRTPSTTATPWNSPHSSVSSSPTSPSSVPTATWKHSAPSWSLPSRARPSSGIVLIPRGRV